MGANRVRCGAVLSLIFAVMLGAGCGQEEMATAPVISRPYLGEQPPGDTPTIFAPGIVSTNTREWSMAFTPDGRELFFGVVTDERSWILHTREVEGRWTEPAVASFSGTFDDFDLTMGPEGNRLYFTSGRPAGDADPPVNVTDIWYVDRTADGWGDPVRFPEPINTDARELYPSVSRDGYLYFFSSRPEGFGEFDLYRAALREGGFGQPENLGEAINTAANETDACISPDGDYLVFTSSREGGFGSGDLYVSFRTDGGGWTPAKNLGEVVNTEHLEFCPSVSRDGKYLFFTSNRPKAEAITETSAVREELGLTPSPDRPDIDVYWVDAAIIETLRAD